MYRRVFISFMAGTVVSLCSIAQTTSDTQSPAASTTAPAAASSQTPAPSNPPAQKPASSKKQKKSKKGQNPIANVDSKQPDKVLYDRAMDAMEHHKYDVARLTLQTLINTYPDSEYVARAKLAVADSWYEEGGTAAMAQAESEYKDFITFFPQMTEASEAQMKIANIHYKEMEKADRDPTHARRAEDEYRQLILQFPDSPLVPQAKQRLLEVQEVLARREYMIGHFYFLRETYPAAIARFQSVVDTYPLYSDADEALFELGNAYEREVDIIRKSMLPETAKGTLIKQYTDGAAAAYGKILTRYPLEARAGDAKKRLEAMKKPVPKATPEAVAQNKAEIASRGSVGTFGKLMENFHKGPDVMEATKTGEPTLVDPKQASAPEMVRAANTSVLSSLGGGGKNTVTVEHLTSGTPAANAAIPRSDAAPGTTANATPPAGGPVSGSAANGNTNSNSAVPEMQNDLAPANGTSPAPPLPPTQVNDAAPSSDKSSSSAPAASSSDAPQAPPANANTESTSKKKKKKVLGIF
ncbi:MAG: outer membrane protein assembly factor BamD [Acidobacteriota bacterium]|nr:outer membrane protein assembly factor BamD [Acidobacteriota bacterium]